MLHTCVTVSFPAHSVPPFWAGTAIVLFRSTVPPPQVTEQPEDSLHSDHSQLTANVLWNRKWINKDLSYAWNPGLMEHNIKCCSPTDYQEFPRSHSGPHPQTTSGSRCPGWCFRSSGPRLSCCLCETCWWSRSLHTFWWNCLLHTRKCTWIRHSHPQVLHQNRDTMGS